MHTCCLCGAAISGAEEVAWPDDARFVCSDGEKCRRARRVVNPVLEVRANPAAALRVIARARLVLAAAGGTGVLPAAVADLKVELDAFDRAGREWREYGISEGGSGHGH